MDTKDKTILQLCDEKTALQLELIELREENRKLRAQRAMLCDERVELVKQLTEKMGE